MNLRHAAARNAPGVRYEQFYFVYRSGTHCLLLKNYPFQDCSQWELRNCRLSRERSGHHVYEKRISQWLLDFG